jgi:hypothetical protein
MTTRPESPDPDAPNLDSTTRSKTRRLSDPEYSSDSSVQDDDYYQEDSPSSPHSGMVPKHLGKQSIQKKTLLAPEASHASASKAPIVSDDEEFEDDIEFDPDIAISHESNDVLKEKKAVKEFFEYVEKNINDFSDPKQREWLGSLPSRMRADAIPLFTDEDTNIDFQLHPSYTWMNAIYTHGWEDHSDIQNAGDLIPDYYVHSLLAIRESESQAAIIPLLDFVIPLGKLFANESGQSRWTGFEIFVNDSLELFGIFSLDEDDIKKWQIVDCKLFTMEFSIREIGGLRVNVRLRGVFRFARSIQTLWSAHFGQGPRLLFSDSIASCSLHLLELPTSRVSEALENRARASIYKALLYRVFETEKLRVEEDSVAGNDLLMLAVKHENISIMRVEFVTEHALAEPHPQTSLQELAEEAGDKRILELLALK